MEIKITHMINDADNMPMLSGSVMELGDNAGSITWENSKRYAKENPFNFTDDQIEELRGYFKDFGAWTEKEIDSWTREEVEGLIAQDIASSIREIEGFESFEEYIEESEKGNTRGNIFKCEKGEFYFQAM